MNEPKVSVKGPFLSLLDEGEPKVLAPSIEQANGTELCGNDDEGESGKAECEGRSLLIVLKGI